MRIMTLADMLVELRNEARLSVDAAHGAHLKSRHISLLRRVQEEVYLSYDWPWLDVSTTVTVVAGNRYLTYPTGMDHQSVDTIAARGTSGKWLTLDYGINAAQLNAYDSDAGDQAENVARWQHATTLGADPTDTDTLEIWPIPNRDVELRFDGKRALAPLTDDASHVSTVDGMVVVLHAAAELLAGQKAEDASLKLQKAQERHRLLKLRQARHSPRINLAG